MLKLKNLSLHFLASRLAGFLGVISLMVVGSQALAAVKVNIPDDDSGITTGCTLRAAIAAVASKQPSGKCVDPANSYEEIHILPSAQSIVLQGSLQISASMKIVGISDENGIRPSIYGPPVIKSPTGFPVIRSLVDISNNLALTIPITVNIENINFRDNNLPASPTWFDNLSDSDTLGCRKYNSSHDTRYCAGGLLRVGGNAHVSITDSTFLNGVIPEFTFTGLHHGRIVGAGGAISVTSRTDFPKAKLSLNRVDFYNNQIVHYEVYKHQDGNIATQLVSRGEGVGAALFLLNANLDANEVTFSKNTSANYPAIFVDDDNDQIVEGVPVNDTLINMNHILVEDNTASYGSDGYRDNVISGHVMGFRAAANHTDAYSINLSNMVIRNNDGGGIFASGFSISNSVSKQAPILIQKTAIVQNKPDGWYRVAGLYLTEGSNAHIVNSTVGENSGAAWAGAIRLDNAELSLLNNTIVESSALAALGSTPFSKNVISMFGNALHHTNAVGTVCDLALSLPNYGFGNVESDNSCQLWPPSNLVNTDPKLMPLDHYWATPMGASKPWSTYAYQPDVLAGSPVLDYRSSCTTQIPNPWFPFKITVLDDQLGTPRQNICDAGAFEYVTKKQ